MDKTTKEGHLKATLKNTTKSSIWSSWCLGPSPSSLLYPVVVKTVDSWPLVPSACRLASSLLPLPVESSAGALGRVPSSSCSKTFQTLWPQLESPFPFTQLQPVHTRDCPLLPWRTPDTFFFNPSTSMCSNISLHIPVRNPTHAQTVGGISSWGICGP